MKIWTLSVLGFSLMGMANAAGPKPDTIRVAGRMAVLDLVDLADNQQRVEVSERLRKALSLTGKWSIIPRDSLIKRLNEFNLNPYQGCNNPQCSFDIGNVVQAEYVLFGTSSLVSGIQAVTLKYLHIPSAKIVWTKVLEGEGISDAERLNILERRFTAIGQELSKVRSEPNKNQHGNSLAIVDLSESSVQSRAFFERVCTRIYGNAYYDLMSPTELTELLGALEINKYSVVPSLENMVGLGQKLGVSNLLYSRLYRDGRSFIYRLAMYDIKSKSLVLELPPQPSEDLIKLLDYEKVFFNTLFSKDKSREKSGPVAVKGNGKSNKALWISLGVLGIGGGVAAYWVENLKTPNSSAKMEDIGFPRPPPPTEPN